jgi:alkylation response protein AidB-like acyl-CoA dehydrogenase
MIDLLPNVEQQQIADSIQRFLANNLPVERHRDIKNRKVKLDKDLWSGLSDLGSFGLTVGEDHGGAGLTVVEEIMAFREYGRFLVSPCVLATVLAARMADAAGQDQLASDLVAGKRRAALMSRLPEATLAAVTSGEFQVFDAATDDLLLAWNETGAALFEYRAPSARQRVSCIDATITLERVSLSNAKPLIYCPADKLPVWQMGRLYLAASLTGILEAIRDLSVAYAKERHQFGNPIGVYQAVKHRCADMALWAEAAWSQTAWAALSLSAGDRDADFQVTNAKAVAGDSAIDAARRAVQIYGGMGFTAEVNVHLFLKRAHVYDQIGGDCKKLYESLVDLAL